MKQLPWRWLTKRHTSRLDRCIDKRNTRKLHKYKRKCPGVLDKAAGAFYYIIYTKKFAYAKIKPGGL